MRLKVVTLPDNNSRQFDYTGCSCAGSNGASSTYGYDGNGDRVRQTKWDGSLFYVRSSVLKDSVMEVNSTGAQRAYVYSTDGKLIAEQSTDSQFYWMHTNHLGSARAMTDVNGNLAYKGQFDPYGQTLFEWSSSGNTNLNTRKFTGYERDVTGLDYAKARTYNSGRGRFMQADPMGRGCQGQKPNPLGAAEENIPQTLKLFLACMGAVLGAGGKQIEVCAIEFKSCLRNVTTKCPMC
jgi:RHS repeat-associated protein